MSRTSTELANLALSELGQRHLLNLETDTGATASRVRLMFSFAWEECLSQRNWLWAVKTTQLALVNTTKTTDGFYKFLKPANFMRIVEAVDEHVRNPIRLEGEHILWRENKLELRYVSNESLNNTALAPQPFQDYFIKVLASRLAWSLMRNADLRNRFLQEAQIKLQDAASFESAQNSARQPEGFTWKESRHRLYSSEAFRYGNLPAEPF